MSGFGPLVLVPRPIDPDNVQYYAGDYPDLGLVTYDNKDPYENWTDNLNRRNWGEQVRVFGAVGTGNVPLCRSSCRT